MQHYFMSIDFNNYIINMKYLEESNLKRTIMKKMILSSFVVFIIGLQFSYAQVSVGVGVGRGFGRYGYGSYYGNSMNRYNRYPQRRRKDENLPKYDPKISFSIGAGFPNLDVNQFAGFFDHYRGTASQSVPIIGSIDYQYSRTSSIGLMVTHGQVSAPYYSYSDFTGSIKAFTGSLDNWTVLLNFMNYLPTNSRLEPYIRTAIGINIWNQNYLDPSGNKIGYVSEPSMLAYQVSIGANLGLSKNLKFYTEAGYGKYILQAGLKFQIQ